MNIKALPSATGACQPSDTSPRVLILAAGEAARWGNHLCVPKFLVPIDGQSLLNRNLDLLRDLGVTDIQVLIAKDAPPLPDHAATLIDAHPFGGPTDKLLSSAHLWAHEGPTMLLFADVAFTRASLQEALTPPAHGVRFVGRMTAGSYSGGRYPEIFAISIAAGSRAAFQAALTDAHDPKATLAGGWYAYRYLAARQEQPGAVPVVFSHIDDLTEDFDRPHQYSTWLKRAQAPQYTPNPVKKRQYLRNGFLLGSMITGLIALGIALVL